MLFLCKFVITHIHNINITAEPIPHHPQPKSPNILRKKPPTAPNIHIVSSPMKWLCHRDEMVVASTMKRYEVCVLVGWLCVQVVLIWHKLKNNCGEF